jgi:hypothetical protein
VALYVALVFALYGLHELALRDGGDSYPDWYGPADLLLRAITSVAPGLLAGWLCRAGGLVPGTAVGMAGGAAEAVILGAVIGVPLTEFGSRIHVAAISTAIASGLTNAVGGVAGAAARREYERRDA